MGGDVEMEGGGIGKEVKNASGIAEEEDRGTSMIEFEEEGDLG